MCSLADSASRVGNHVYHYLQSRKHSLYRSTELPRVLNQPRSCQLIKVLLVQEAEIGGGLVIVGGQFLWRGNGESL
jgi:hypothetical protein